MTNLLAIGDTTSRLDGEVSLHRVHSAAADAAQPALLTPAPQSWADYALNAASSCPVVLYPRKARHSGAGTEHGPGDC